MYELCHCCGKNWLKGEGLPCGHRRAAGTYPDPTCSSAMPQVVGKLVRPICGLPATFLMV